MADQSGSPSPRLFTFENCTDYALIRKIMTSPRVWAAISDDFSPSPELFRPTISTELCYVLVRHNDLPIGLFLLTAHNGVHCEVHTCLLPTAYVRGSREIGKQAIAWLWKNAPQIERLTTTVPRNNSLALRFAQALGMIEYGVNPRSFKKGGELVDQILLGMNRPQETT
jgi:RimJ/RimL family protein N-acetyltransferase